VLAFARALAAYPLPGGVVEVSSGFAATDDRPPQEHVGLRAAPVGPRGQVGIRVHLSTELWPDTRPESRHDVQLELLTSYERLAAFSPDLVRVIDGKLDEATIGEKLA
jgi:hypothetical protein